MYNILLKQTCDIRRTIHRKTASWRTTDSRTTQPEKMIHHCKTDCNIFPSIFGSPVFMFGVGSGTEGHVYNP